jgi:flagellar biosynthesis anti-sigma factor FlgM
MVDITKNISASTIATDSRINRVGSESAHQSHSKDVPQAELDSVNVTTQAKDILSKASNLAKDAGINREKINAIKTALAEGKYPLDPHKTAAQLIKLENEVANI